MMSALLLVLGIFRMKKKNWRFGEGGKISS